MDGRSCVLEKVPGVTSDGISPTSSAGTDIPLEKRCASVDETCEQAESDNGSLEAEMCMGFSKSVGLGAKKGLQKCVTFPPSSGEAQQESGSCRHSDEGLKGAPAYERSVSLPPTLKLISAMKGSRQKNGMASPTESRHIKWAPDVYDPPVTSVCHSVNNSYQRRSKSRKKEKNKQKKHKGKSKKKHQNCTQNSSALKAPDLGFKDVSTSGCRSAPDDLRRHEAEMVAYSIGNQEAKCGSSFLHETIAKMHFSIAEAS
ncbi:uncharacterized protein LOC133928292 [Phragmites australis]|uniref:uncharacterized protein LOC133928292 n=1 Tax=Phragmites australis TaxID=29695 RepID=UPI002D7A0ACD|nr:uncharacterized protein LOC133928292 [Phragmites australis]XP_062230539.1 uncharacterized protein LOC133928292 [Phragmites australis]